MTHRSARAARERRIGVVGHGYDEMGGAGMEVVIGKHTGQRLEDGRIRR